MSKYVKNLITQHIRDRLRGVEAALLVNVVGLDANRTSQLRAELRRRNIHLMVVKNSLAARAVADTPLAGLMEGVTGSAAICWGGEDVVTLAKEVIRLANDTKFAPFAARGGILDGRRLTPETVAEVSKWPTRQDLLTALVSRILGPGAQLAGQVLGPGASLASQIQQKAEPAPDAQPPS